jgi:hypothetical protein
MSEPGALIDVEKILTAKFPKVSVQTFPDAEGIYFEVGEHLDYDNVLSYWMDIDSAEFLAKTVLAQIKFLKNQQDNDSN